MWHSNGNLGDRFDFNGNNRINNVIPNRNNNRFDGDLNNNGIQDRLENQFNNRFDGDLNNNGIQDRLENRFDGDLNNNGIQDRLENRFDNRIGQDLNHNGIPDRYENGSAINFGGRRCRIVCDGRGGRYRNDNCRIVCDDRRYPDNGGFDQNRVRRLILGRSLIQARRVYSNIRVVRQDGLDLIVTRDFRRDRANVEVNNGIIIRVLGFY